MANIASASITTKLGPIISTPRSFDINSGPLPAFRDLSEKFTQAKFSRCSIRQKGDRVFLKEMFPLFPTNLSFLIGFVFSPLFLLYKAMIWRIFFQNTLVKPRKRFIFEKCHCKGVIVIVLIISILWLFKYLLYKKSEKKWTLVGKYGKPRYICAGEL